MDVYVTVLSCIVALVLGVGLLRMVSQALFLKRHMKMKFWDGCIPFATNIKLYKKFSLQKLNYIGMALRIGGAALMIITLLWQYYESMMQLTHMYGLLFQTYTPVDYSTLWNIMSWGGIILILAGMACRLIAVKRFSRFFCIKSGFFNFCGMVEPAFYFVLMSLSHKAQYILDKPTKKLSREEQALCRTLSKE